MRISNALRLAAATAVVALTTAALVAPVPTASASSPVAGAPSFSQSETISRPYVHAGTSGVDTRTVTLQVSRTSDLRGRQEVGVSWTGAHPTGGIVSNPNSAAGEQEEYPMVLLECRGTVSATDPVTPQTCWTQDWNSRYADNLTGNRDGLWPAYRLDADQSSPGAALVGAPSQIPASCRSLETAAVQYWIPWAAQSGTVYQGGLGGACGEPPEATDSGNSALPSNETYGVTALDGTGSVNFDILDSTENTTLGCSSTIACSLVAVPIMGINCDASLIGSDPTTAQLSALSDCEDTGFFAPGSLQSSQGSLETEPTVSGRLWWSPSNWDNRIVVPLTFAPTSDSCNVVDSGNSVQIYGSELMLQATSQWIPEFCTSGTNRFQMVHVAEAEPQARNQVATGSSVAALTSFAQPLGYGKPVVDAPVGLSGFAISFVIDDQNGNAVKSLKLTPLLLAKLLTESYPGLTAGQGGDPALASNPIDIARDPEFEALNPGINPFLPNTIAASELASLSSNSDVMWALTSYIESDAAARSFLQGVPDTSMSGEDMVVNPAYKGIKLPVERWPLLANYESDAFDNNATNAPCLQDNPQPLGTLIASPLPTLEEISLDLQYAKANSTMTCASTGADGNISSMVANGTETPGHRFLIGVTPLADDARFGLTPASLQTTNGTFVAPSDASLQAAASLLRPDQASGTWPLDYDVLHTSPGAAAYPGTMVVYLAVPTTGLGKTVAADLATVLQFAAGPGQTRGSGVGQLPAGYLPLTSQYGLAALSAYTATAAEAVATQSGKVPPLIPTKPVTTTTVPTGRTVPTVTTTTLAPSNTSTTTVVSSTGTTVPSSRSKGGSSDSAGSRSSGAAPAPAGPIAAFDAVDARLWLEGFPVVVPVAFAVLGALAVPTVFRRGRRLGRW